MSCPRSTLDLNLAFSGQVTGDTPTLQPFITPISIFTTPNDSVMENPTTALRVANQLLTPRDHEFLSWRSDQVAVDESLRLNI